MNVETGWVAVICRPANENLAAQSLEAAGFTVYLPRYRKLLRGVRLVHNKRVRTRSLGDYVWRPLFPGYLFASITSQHPLGLMCRSLGVSGYLRREDRRPAFILPEILERLRYDEISGIWNDGPQTENQKRLQEQMQGIGPPPIVAIPELNDALGEIGRLDANGRIELLVRIGTVITRSADVRLVETVDR